MPVRTHYSFGRGLKETRTKTYIISLILERKHNYATICIIPLECSGLVLNPAPHLKNRIGRGI